MQPLQANTSCASAHDKVLEDFTICIMESTARLANKQVIRRLALWHFVWID